MGWEIKNGKPSIDHGVIKNLGDEFSESFYDINPFMLKQQIKNPDQSGQPLIPDDGPKNKNFLKRTRPLQDDDEEEVKKVRN